MKHHYTVYKPDMHEAALHNMQTRHARGSFTIYIICKPDMQTAEATNKTQRNQLYTLSKPDMQEGA
jgi:hypothetical protein